MTKCDWCGSSVSVRISVLSLLRFNYEDDRFCQQCRGNLIPLADHQRCCGCSKIQDDSELCRDCLMWKNIYPDYSNNHHALFAYNAFAKELVGRFKFTGDCEVAYLFKSDIKAYFRKKEKTSIIVPIPISLNSQTTRGFNQTELLLEAADVSYLPLLENKYQTEKQSKKNRDERLKTIQPFVIQEQDKQLVKGNNIILTDDIYTTGRTLFHAIELINRCEPASVESFSLFR